jgi:hypothetical protein
MKKLLTLLFLLFPLTSHAVITEVASRKTQNGTTTASDSLAQSFVGTPATGEFLVVTGVADGTNSSIGVTDNRGNTYTVLTYATGVYRMFIAYAFAGSTNTVLVTVNPSPNNCKITMVLDSFAGVHATPLDVTIAGATGTSTAPSVSITPTVNGTVTVGFETQAGASVVQDPPSGWTQMGELNGGVTAWAGNGSFLINTTTAPVTGTWTLDSSQAWIAVAAVFKAADSSAPSTATLRHRIYSE